MGAEIFQVKNHEEKEEQNHTKKYLTDFGEENYLYLRRNILVGEIYPICQDDTGYRPEHMTTDAEIIPEY